MGQLASQIQATKRDQLPGCAVMRKYAKVAVGLDDDEDREALLRAINDPDYSPNVVAKLLGRLGQTVSHGTVTVHRQHGDCVKQAKELAAIDHG